MLSYDVELKRHDKRKKLSPASIPSNRSPRDVFILTLSQGKTLRAMEIFFVKIWALFYALHSLCPVTNEYSFSEIAPLSLFLY